MTNINLFRQTINKLPNSSNFQDLAIESRKYINHHVFRGYKLTPNELIEMFDRLSQRCRRNTRHHPELSWLQEEKKIYQCFFLAYRLLSSKKIMDFKNQEWQDFSRLFGNKSILLLQYEAHIIERSSQRVRWTQQEQKTLSSCTRTRELKWADISRHIFFTSQCKYFKTPKQCRERWNNHMNEEITHGGWNIEEDIWILDLVQEEGRKWARIALRLDSRRTEHMIKNRYHSLMTCSRNLVRPKDKHKLSENELILNMKGVLEKKLKKMAQVHRSTNRKQQEQQNNISEQESQKQIVEEQSAHFQENSSALPPGTSQNEGLLMQIFNQPEFVQPKTAGHISQTSALMGSQIYQDGIQQLNQQPFVSATPGIQHLCFLSTPNTMFFYPIGMQQVYQAYL